MKNIWKWFKDGTQQLVRRGKNTTGKIFNWFRKHTKLPTKKGGVAMEKILKWLSDRKVFMVIVGTLYLVFTIIFFLLWDKKLVIGKTENALEIYWCWIWLAAVVAYSLRSITGTGLNERALKLFLDKMPVGVEVPPQKITFVPLWLFVLFLVPIEIQENELPGEPEQIWRFKDDKDQELPLGTGKKGEGLQQPQGLPWVQPIRVLFNNKDPEEDKDPIFETTEFPSIPKIRKQRKRNGKDPALKRVTAEVVCVLQWRVRDISAFFRTYGSFRKATKALSDIVISEMTAVLQAGTADRALSNQELLGHHILRKVRERMDHEVVVFQEKKDEAGNLILDSDNKPVIEEIHPGHPKGETKNCRRGVEIVLVQLKPPGFSHDYNQSIQSVPQATAEAEAEALRGEGEKKRMELLKEYAGGAGGEMMLALEKLKTIKETIGKKDDKIILVDSTNPIAALFGAVTAGKGMLEEKKTSSPEKSDK